MRPQVLVLAMAATLAASPVHASADCASDVAAAFTKQRQSKAYRSVVTSPAANDGAEQVFEYKPPMLMRRAITAPNLPEPMESIGFGNRAWLMEGGVWYEMQPHFAQTHEQHLRELFGAPPVIKAKYECLGETTREGMTYKAYRTEPEKSSDGEMLTRTVYVDAKSGLPVLNIVGTVDGSKPDLSREAYSYPDDIEIIIPEGAEMRSIQN